MVYTLGTGEDFLGLIPLVHGEWQLGEEEGTMQRVKVEGAGKPMRTLYLQMENTEYSMEVRGRIIAEAHGHTIEPDDDDADREDFIMIIPRMEMNLLDPVDAEALIQVAMPFDIVVMDSTYNMVYRTLNDDEVAKALTRVINRLVSEADVTVIAIHHSSTKGEGGKGKGRESMGSTFFTSAFWDHEIRLNYDRPDRLLHTTFVSRDTDLDDLQFRFIDAGLWELVDPEAEAASQLDDVLNDIQDWLDEDPANQVWRMANGALRVGGSYGSQEDLAAHLGVTQALLRRGLGRWLDLQEISHGPSLD
jgi:hypothetical protein